MTAKKILKRRQNILIKTVKTKATIDKLNAEHWNDQKLKLFKKFKIKQSEQ